MFLKITIVGKKNCATTKNRPIGKIEYIATVDRLVSYIAKY